MKLPTSRSRMDNKCVQCGELYIAIDKETDYKDYVVYICPNNHREAFQETV